jgi:hypothetical protein
VSPRHTRAITSGTITGSSAQNRDKHVNPGKAP